MSRLGWVVAIVALASGCCNGGICSMRYASPSACNAARGCGPGIAPCSHCNRGLAMSRGMASDDSAESQQASFRPPIARFHPVPTAPVFHPAPELTTATYNDR